MTTRTANIRKVRNDFGAVLAWVARGEEVTILNRTRPVARICPPRARVPAKVELPDFAARARAVFGKKIIPNTVLREREEHRW